MFDWADILREKPAKEVGQKLELYAHGPNSTFEAPFLSRLFSPVRSQYSPRKELQLLSTERTPFPFSRSLHENDERQEIT